MLESMNVFLNFFGICTKRFKPNGNIYAFWEWFNLSHFINGWHNRHTFPRMMYLFIFFLICIVKSFAEAERMTLIFCDTLRKLFWKFCEMHSAFQEMCIFIHSLDSSIHIKVVILKSEMFNYNEVLLNTRSRYRVFKLTLYATRF